MGGSTCVEVEATSLPELQAPLSAARAVPPFLASSGFKELLVDEATHGKAVDLFAGDGRLSLTDASSVLLMGVVGAKALLGFDTRSFAGRGLEVIGAGCWESPPVRDKKRVRALERGPAKGA